MTSEITSSELSTGEDTWIRECPLDWTHSIQHRARTRVSAMPPPRPPTSERPASPISLPET